MGDLKNHPQFGHLYWKKERFRGTPIFQTPFSLDTVLVTPPYPQFSREREREREREALLVFADG